MTVYHPNADIGVAKFNTKTGGGTNKFLTVTVPAKVKEFHVVDWITGSFNVAGEAKVSIAVGGTEIWVGIVHNAKHFRFAPSPPHSAKNQEMIIKLFGDAGATGTLSTGIRTSATPVAAAEA